MKKKLYLRGVLACQNIHIRQGNFSLSNLSFEIQKGAYHFLLGRTGSGKTTLMEIICGLRDFESGKILMNGEDITHKKPADRNIGFVPQDGALFQHLCVAKNIGFSLKVRGLQKRQIKERVETIASQLNISHLLSRKPNGLSGGEKQRVALARALIFKPSLLCLDEPLSALDNDTKKNIIALLFNIKKTFDMTVLHITHDQYQAEKLADSLLSIKNGTLKKQK